VALLHKAIEALLSAAQDPMLMEYRQATIALQVPLSPDMAAALGTPYRRLTPFLSTVVDVISSKMEIQDAELKLAKVGDTKAVRQWLDDASWSLIERELFQAVVRDGKAFLLTAWTEDRPRFSVIGAYDGTCGAHAVCDEDTTLFAWNTWTRDGNDGTGTRGTRQAAARA